MSGGTVSGNTANSGNGGGVHVSNGFFTMSGGTEISGNEAIGGNGGGVNVAFSGVFTMSGGTIGGNRAIGGNGGGVHVNTSSTNFTKVGGGTISAPPDSNANTAGMSGHAVFIIGGNPALIKDVTVGLTDDFIGGIWIP
jgi:hypothetical protein